MTTHTITITAPVLAGRDLSAEVVLFERPTDAMHCELKKAGFMPGLYADIRRGRVGGLDAALAAVAEHEGQVWRISTPAQSPTREVIGDLLTHAQMFVPDAVSAELLGTILVLANTPLTQVNGRWVVWAQASIRVTA